MNVNPTLDIFTVKRFRHQQDTIKTVAIYYKISENKIQP